MNVNKPFIGAAALAALAATVTAVQAAGRIEVEFVKPQEFADAGRSAIDRERVQASLSQFVQRRLAVRLPDGQTLRLEVTDIDLAGELYPARWAHELRVLRGGADWPRMTLNYTLLDGTRTVKSGEAKLSDPAYMFGTHGSAGHDSELAYEKRMLQNWFDEHFAAARR